MLKEIKWWQHLWIVAGDMQGGQLQAALNQHESDSPYSVSEECIVFYNFELLSVDFGVYEIYQEILLVIVFTRKGLKRN